MQNNIIKEEPDSYGECQSSSNDRVVTTKHEELPEPFAFVSVKEEVEELTDTPPVKQELDAKSVEQYSRFPGPVHSTCTATWCGSAFG